MSGGEARAIRKSLGLKQPEFAQMVGVHPVTVSKYETGALPIPEPTARLMRLLAKPTGKRRRR